MPSRERISNVDTAWLRMDRPSNLMQIVGVMLFDGMLDFERLKLAVEKRLLAHRRFVQCVVADGTGYCWQDDPDFDLGNHLRRVVRRGRLDKAGLQRFVADLAAKPLDQRRPLWEMLVVDTALGGQALVLRIHHSIADGIALVGVILSLADGASGRAGSAPVVVSANHDAGEDDHEQDIFWRALWHPLAEAGRLVSGLRDQYSDLLSNPKQLMGFARVSRDVAGEIAKLATMANDSPTRFKGKLGTRKQLAWSEPIPLPEIKEVGRVLGCSVNDLLLTAVAGSLRAYLVDRGEDVAGVEIRAMVPVNLRGPDDTGTLGNRFGLVTLELPLDDAGLIKGISVNYFSGRVDAVHPRCCRHAAEVCPAIGPRPSGEQGDGGHDQCPGTTDGALSGWGQAAPAALLGATVREHRDGRLHSLVCRECADWPDDWP